MTVKFKKTHPEAVTPFYATEGSAGLDLTAITKKYDEFNNVVIGTGIAVQIPENHVGLLVPRSSISKTSMMMRNSVGIIDSDYTGELMFKFNEVMTSHGAEYNVGDRIGQLVIVPCVQGVLEEVEELTKTTRGNGGFGSTGQ